MTTSSAGVGFEHLAPQRALSQPAKSAFKTWTLTWIASTLAVMVLFYVGVLDFVNSSRASMYLISVWLNGWIVVWFLRRYSGQQKEDLYHDLLVVWMVSYAITNIQWEIPWVIFSPFVFENIVTLEDLVAQTDYMREKPWHLYYWVLSTFGALDLRTVNHNGTFYALEWYAFVNLATTFYFFHLNNKRSPYRYLVVVLGCGEPIATTFIFTFSEVFDGFVNMPGNIWDTLLALVWTQYQYFVFPMIFGAIGCKLLVHDWRHS
ncbi:hypothetical protein EY643_09010 [Halioglobus maricola]|uniref:Uncharacterized protein n=1 Tax=Halioglobus maricola TaxID=2601894 RepID=A0A5P9NJW9_9GAMM|nr:hypothetical protein [Halioglobus maricola]QFU75786.1 hypothetical protein EY643_09010 [Halioglobus maricola]